MNSVTCQKCDGYVPGHATGAGDICTCDPITTMDDTNPKDRIGVAKPNLNLVPPALIIHTAKAMENGAAKFGSYNWRRNKVKATIYLAAAMRHILAFQDGENTAEDSGVHHLGHAAACLGILLDAQAGGQLIDDRPEPGPAAKLIKELTVTEPRRLKKWIEPIPPFASTIGFDARAGKHVDNRTKKTV